MNAAQVIRTFYLGVVISSLLFNRSPFLREKYLGYGSRNLPLSVQSTTATEPQSGKDSVQATKNTSLSWLRILDGLVLYPLPHTCFKHFYVLSLASSLFWGYQILTQGHALRTICSDVAEAEKSMSLEQVALVWSLLTIQGCRRLYETITLSKETGSTMPLSHYLLAFGYYIATGIGMWIEGSGAILSSKSVLKDMTLSAPSARTMLFIPIFILASGVQHDCHTYLASLKKYTLPMHPAFLHITCPHYTAECFIYLALAFLSAPQGTVINKTVLANLIFVLVELGLTADMNKAWYAKKFGAEKVARRWRMVPLIW